MGAAWPLALALGALAAGCPAQVGDPPPQPQDAGAPPVEDAGPSDGGGADGGGGDAGSQDAGTLDAGPDPCAPIPGVSYTTTQVTPFTADPANQGGLNLLQCGWRSVNESKGYVSYGGGTDPKAPKLHTLYADDRRPASFVDVAQLRERKNDGSCDSTYVTTWPVTLVGMPSVRGEVIELPESGYDIGGGHGALVLYATDRTVTLKYTRDDNIITGYTLHLAGVCVEPSLRAAYERCHQQGRSCMPQLRSHQPLGRAIGGQLDVAIRDTGSLMDPRSRKDWWQ